jgi:hypothetical protein
MTLVLGLAFAARSASAGENYWSARGWPSLDAYAQSNCATQSAAGLSSCFRGYLDAPEGACTGPWLEGGSGPVTGVPGSYSYHTFATRNYAPAFGGGPLCDGAGIWWDITEVCTGDTGFDQSKGLCASTGKSADVPPNNLECGNPCNPATGEKFQTCCANHLMRADLRT